MTGQMFSYPCTLLDLVGLMPTSPGPFFSEKNTSVWLYSWNGSSCWFSKGFLMTSVPTPWGWVCSSVERLLWNVLLSLRENSSLGGLCLPQEHGNKSVTNSTSQNISETLPVRLKLRHSPAKAMAVMSRAVKSTASITWQATRASGFISMLWPAGEQTFSASAGAPRAAACHRPCQEPQGLVSCQWHWTWGHFVSETPNILLHVEQK